MTYDINNRIDAMHLTYKYPERTTSILKGNFNTVDPVLSLIREDKNYSQADVDRTKAYRDYTQAARDKMIAAGDTKESLDFETNYGTRPIVLTPDIRAAIKEFARDQVNLAHDMQRRNERFAEIETGKRERPDVIEYEDESHDGW